MRVVVRVEHRGSPPGSLAHRVTAAEPMLSRTCAALANARDWPDQLIDVLTSCVRAKDRPPLTRLAFSPERPAGVERGSPPAAADLVSWIIAA